MKKNQKVNLIFGLLLVLLNIPGFAGDQKQNRIVLRNPELGAPVTPYVFVGDVRNLPPPPQWRPGDPIIEIPRRSKPAGERSKDQTRPVPMDPLLSLQENAPQVPGAFTTPTRNFPGGGFSGANPPDTVGDVGPNHYIQGINGSGGTEIRIWDKATPTPNLIASFVLDSLATGGPCATGLGDPIVLYDRYSDRWMLSEFSSSGNNLCVYISQTSDPVSGGWYAYGFTAPQFPDYPKYAIWPTDENGGQGSIIVTTNEDGPVVYALQRGPMLTGGAASSIRFSTIPPLSGFPFEGTLAPADPDGPMPPPTGAPATVIQHRDTEVHGAGPCPAQDCLEVWELSVDWNTPANTTLVNSQNIVIAEIDSDLCGLSSFSCFPQPGSGITLDPLREPVMNRLQYMNVGGQQYLIGNFVTDVDGTDHGGMRWFELRGSAGAWTLFQEGTYAPDAHNRWIGGISMDKSNNIALGYSLSSTTEHPEIRYTGRQKTDPLGTMTQTETQIVNGTSPNGSNRWGDYASMNLDPSDDCTFWYTNMYNTSTQWSTRIASMKFDACGFAGSVGLNQNSYRCSDTMTVTVTDAHLISAGTQNVTIWSTTEPTPETVTLAETPAGSGTFTGTFPTSTVPATSGDGQLSVSHGDTITVQYIDSDDGQGHTNVPVQDTAVADCQGPVISNLQVINITGTTATITWNTDENSDSEVTYDTVSPPTANTATDPDNVTSHSVQLTGLTPCTQYFFLVRSTDPAGNQASDDNSGTYYSFTTGLQTTTTYVSSDVPKPIQDLQTTTSVINIPDNVNIADLNVQLSLTHTWDGDLDISLQSPTGIIIDLSSDNGGSGNNYTGTVFDDEAATPINAGSAPFTGTFRPEQPLSTYDGLSAAGTWTLRIFDDTNQDTGTLTAWSLILTTSSPCVPCPTITISPSTLPDGMVGVAYNQTVSGSGGQAPYTYAVTSGTLPTGLSLNPTTGAITGTPSATGAFPFQITATDNNGCTGSQSYSITINAAPPCLFCDDFQDGIQPNWTIFKPNFTETGGNYVGTPTGRKAETIAIPAFPAGCSNCYVEAAVTTAGGPFNRVWVLGWWVDKNNLVELLMKEETDRWILKQRINKTVVAKNKKVSTILPNVTYIARVSFDGTTFTVTIDGNQLFTMTKAAGSNPAGTVGFRVKNTTGTFGFITVN